MFAINYYLISGLPIGLGRIGKRDIVNTSLPAEFSLSCGELIFIFSWIDRQSIMAIVLIGGNKTVFGDYAEIPNRL
jgi:hypothetical protein